MDFALFDWSAVLVKLMITVIRVNVGTYFPVAAVLFRNVSVMNVAKLSIKKR